MTEIVLGIWVAAAFVALCWRLLLLGAELSDLEVLIAQQRNGLTRIESIQHVRTETLFVLVAFCFLTIGLLALTVEAAWRGEVSRYLLLFSSALMAAAPIWDWLDRRRKLRLTVREGEEQDTAKAGRLESERKSYQEMTDEAITRLEQVAAAARADRGEPPMPELARVVPEHSSPTTAAQQETADLQTYRARLVAAALDLGQPPRTASPADEPEPPPVRPS